MAFGGLDPASSVHLVERGLGRPVQPDEQADAERLVTALHGIPADILREAGDAAVEGRTLAELVAGLTGASGAGEQLAPNRRSPRRPSRSSPATNTLSCSRPLLWVASQSGANTSPRSQGRRPPSNLSNGEGSCGPLRPAWSWTARGWPGYQADPN